MSFLIIVIDTFYKPIGFMTLPPLANCREGLSRMIWFHRWL